MNTLPVLKIVLALVAAAHLIIGLAAIFVPVGNAADAVISATYGASFDIDPVTRHVIRILGAFMVFVGAMSVVASLDPRRNRPIIYALVLLLLIRVLQRLVFADEIRGNFDISTVRLVTQSVFFVVVAIALYALGRRSEAQESG